MPPRDPNLPEGTDSIIDGTSDLSGTGGSAYGQGSGLGGTSSGSDLGGGAGNSGLGATGSGVLGGGMDDVDDGMDDLGGSAAYGSGSTGAVGSSDLGATGAAYGAGSTGLSSTGGSTAGSSGAGMDVQSLKTQATEKVRDVALQGKDRATEAMDSVSRLVSETADTVDERLGPQYGNYVRRAADALDGLNDSIRGKEVDELFDDARNFVRQSPAVAIGAAAAIGFLLVRLVKSGMPQTISQDDDYYASGSTRLTPTAPRVDNSYDPAA